MKRELRIFLTAPEQMTQFSLVVRCEEAASCDDPYDSGKEIAEVLAPDALYDYAEWEPQP